LNLILKKNKVQIIFVLLVIFLLFLPVLYNNQEKSISELNNRRQPRLSYEVPQTTQWIKNPTFESPIEPTWFWTNGTEGDNSDVEATTSPNWADFKILGEKNTTKLIYGTPNQSSSPGWKKVQNGIYQYPNTAEINSQGCHVSHVWSEDTNQFPSVHWRTNVSMNVDMSDYKVTSISLDINFSASVQVNVDTPNDEEIGSPPDPQNWWEYFATGDYVEFYAEISDIYYIEPYRVAYNKTRYLGQNSPQITTIDDSLLFTYNKTILIDAIIKAFEKDPDHSNFTIVLGMNIYSEDNRQGTDTDTYNDLFIKTCNLTITYEKIINEFTTISWNQIGNQLSGADIQLTGASFNFKYKVDKLWPASAPLSEIRLFLNNKIYSEGTIKLISANTTFQEAKLGGFDVYGFIEKDINISVSIEIFLKDKFDLNETITISIDDVYLNVSYIVTYPDKEINLELFLNGENKTLDPILDVPIDTMLNITVKYYNETGDHIEGAIIQVIGEKLLENLTENSIMEYYSINFNVTDNLIMGVNILTIKALFPDHETKIIFPRITVRKIRTEIATVSGSSSININSGEDASLQIVLNNTDFGGTIKGAIVTYTWRFGEDFLTDLDNDGIYEVTLQNIPSGTYTIIISAFAGDDYDLQNYEITLNVIKPVGPDYSWLLFLLIGAIISLGTIFGLYQAHFKYPLMVRKIRKLRKKIGKGRKIKPVLINKRDEIISNRIQDNLQILSIEVAPLKGTQGTDKINKTEGLK